MMLTKYAIESMGFTEIPAGDNIEAAFHSLHVFEVRGFTLAEAGVATMRGSASGSNYGIAVGESINETCSRLVSGSFADDEAGWAEKWKCTPPYVVIHFGPTSPHSVEQGYVKAESDELLTYDTFGAARAELQVLETEALPSVEMALACTFSLAGRRIQLRPVERVVFGITPSGTLVHDLRVTGRAEAYVSTPLTAAEIESRMQRAVSLAQSADPRVSQFFQLGLRDSDNLKRFLYYFLAIEIEVHRVFRTVSPAQHIANAASLDCRTSTSVAHLLEARENWKNLADRFTWCVVSVWKHLSDTDITEFKRLKKIRDGIAHGDIASPDPAAVAAVESLATRIHT